MKIISKICMFCSFLYIIGCSDANKKQNTTTANKALTDKSLQAKEPPSTSAEKQPPTIPSLEPSEILPVQKPTIQAPKDVEIAMNPPHGQPGHDCAIPVGAPLNAQPQKTAPMQLNGPRTPIAEKVNPPHGQPGHDCAIPVGAPLNN